MPAIVTVFRISVFGLACLGSLILAFAEEAPLPALLTLPLALVAFALTERARRIELTPLAANLFGLLAFLAAGLEFSSDSLESRFLALAHLLVYLTWVLLFQPKRIPQYWWLCALAVLQVAVGTVLTKDGTFGVLLVLFLLASIWTLAVFSLFQALVRTGHQPELAAFAARTEGRRDFEARAGSNGSAAPAGEASPAAMTRLGRAAGAVQCDPGERWIGGRFIAGVFGTTAASLLLAAAFFVFIPRFWIGNRAMPNSDTGFGSLRTGFTDEVQLGDIGQILESTERVFDVRVARIDADYSIHPLEVEEFARMSGYGADGEPLFRGAVLGQYERGRWITYRGQFERTFQRTFLPPIVGPEDYPIVRQEYRLRGGHGAYLFAMPPVAGCVLGKPIEGDINNFRRRQLSGPKATRHELLTQTILAPGGEGEIRYCAYSPYEAQSRFAQTLEYRYRNWLDDHDNAYYRAVPRGLSRLSALAREVGRGITTQRAIAEKFVRYLRDEGGFTYSLDVSIEDATIDPVEDFLFNRKYGHCEYYASALALMLRSVGIPARLVSGFKGGTKNRLTGYYEVEARHAHAWVEAHLDGRWVPLDATPAAARNESLERLAAGFRPWREFRSLLSELWHGYVVGMNPEKQQAEFYAPLRKSVRAWWRELRDGTVNIAGLWNFVRDLLSSPEKWLSWQAWVVTFALLLALAGIIWAAGRMGRMLYRSFRGFQKRSRPRDSGIAFYERFRALCRARGLDRQLAQTPREFAAAVSGALGDQLARADLAEFPAELIDWFYRVRYGNRPLDTAMEALLISRLERLEVALSERNGNGRPQ